MHKEWCQAIKNWLSKHVLLGWVGQASLAHADPGLRTTSPMRISYICRRSQKLHPTFKTDSDTQRANEVFIKKFSQRKDQSHGFIPPLRDFTVQNRSHHMLTCSKVVHCRQESTRGGCGLGPQIRCTYCLITIEQVRKNLPLVQGLNLWHQLWWRGILVLLD